MTPSEEIASLYKQTEKRPDKYGRIIETGLLPPSKITAVLRFANSDVESVFTRCLVAASVRRIDEKIFPFPRSEGDLNLVMDALDTAGMAAATEGLVALRAKQTDAEPADDSGSPASE